MAVQDADYRFSIGIHIEELEVLYALRGIAMFAQKTGNVYKPWKHAGKEEWKQQRRVVKMHFTKAEFRDEFMNIAKRLLGSHFTIAHDPLDSDPLPP